MRRAAYAVEHRVRAGGIHGVAARFAVGIALLCIATAGRVAAQDLGEQRIGTSMLTFLKIGVGARAVGMGEAFTPVADDATTLFWNPAGLALLESRHVHATHTEWPADIDHDAVMVSVPVPQLGGGLGLQVISLRTTLDYTSEVEPLPTGRTFAFSDLLIGGVYARQLNDRFSFGFGIKYLREDLGSEVGGGVVNSWAADVGTVFQLPFRNFRMCMAWTGLGPDFKPSGGFVSTSPSGTQRDVEFQSFSPASVFAFGAALEPLQLSHARLLTSIQFDHPADTEELLKGGAELWFDEIVAVRAGWNPRAHEMRFSAGFGLRGALAGRVLHLDYAYTDGNDLGRIDRFSLEVEF
jgi:uncharacterized protein UPF0164